MNTGKVILIGAGTIGAGFLAFRAIALAKKVSNIESNLKINPEFSKIHGLQKGNPSNLIVYFRIKTLNNSGFDLTVNNIIAEMSYTNDKNEFISCGISPRLAKMSMLDGKEQSIDFPFVLNMKETIGLFLNKPTTPIKIEVKYEWNSMPQSSITIFQAKDYFDATKIKGVAQNVIDALKKIFGKKGVSGVNYSNPIYQLV